MSLSDQTLLILISYLIGSIPFAFILFKFSQGKDIRQFGTGNVGAMNTFEVSGSKGLGVLVGILDWLKGIAAVLVARNLFPAAYSESPAFINSVAALFVVVGHIFPLWLRFKGGRGLATAFGATVLFALSLPISWIIVWALAWGYSKNIHFCNISGTVGMLLIAPFFENVSMLYFIIFLSGFILLAHRDVYKIALRN
ncbi:MAG: glycerol-3-phosphate acyltransferase [Chloroherpetonaceae bacterium]|nr:glycerol-3-phosphate acyltransferase [Chloroherpetonaceae bacterium]